MRERIARAIDPEAFGLPDNAAQDSITDRDIARDRADAVLAVMRAPSPEMIAAMNAIEDREKANLKHFGVAGFCVLAYAAAIDAAGASLTQNPSAPADVLNDRDGPARSQWVPHDWREMLSHANVLNLNRRPK